LVKHTTSSQEIADLLGVADRDLTDYNAVLQSATAALAAAGYRPSRESHHYRVIQSLAYTIDASPELIAQFNGKFI
jgi:hypothetical protein